jgi:drug/metabolite transporter (DMT)-like permease
MLNEGVTIRVAPPGSAGYPARMTPIDVLLLGGLSAIWGGSFIFMRYLAPLIGPVATADSRMLIAGLVLAAGFAVARYDAGWRRNWRHFLVLGVLNSAVPFLLYSLAALVLPASLEAIFNALSPMFGAVFAAMWLGERLTARKAAGLVLGAAGVAFTSGFSGVALDLRTGLAMAGCLLAPACYGLSGVYLKKRAAGVPSLAVAGGSQLFGGLALLPFLLVAPPGRALVEPRIVLIVVAFALLCNALAYVIYFRLMATVGPTRALTVTFLVPVFSMAWGWLFLREPVTWGMAAGAVAILAGTGLVVGSRPLARGRR